MTHRGRSKLPPGVDRTRLEVRLAAPLGLTVWAGLTDGGVCFLFRQRHLSADDFQRVFGMSMAEFDRLSLWRRNDLKKKASLF